MTTTEMIVAALTPALLLLACLAVAEVRLLLARVRMAREARRVEGRFYGDLELMADPAVRAGQVYRGTAVGAAPSKACDRCDGPARNPFLGRSGDSLCWGCFDTEAHDRFLAPDPVLARDYPDAIPARCEGCHRKPAVPMAVVGGKHLCGWCAVKEAR